MIRNAANLSSGQRFKSSSTLHTQCLQGLVFSERTFLGAECYRRARVRETHAELLSALQLALR